MLGFAQPSSLPCRSLSTGEQEDVLVRYGDEADFSGPGLEFLMRQPEVRSCLVKGKPVTPAQYWEGREDEL